uniref:Uncharacterized protein n=1 Tax=Panagrolaimus sp. JU765 TaxID=591449 RepID=A0AC34QVS6_9BILA
MEILSIDMISLSIYQKHLSSSQQRTKSSFQNLPGTKHALIQVFGVGFMDKSYFISRSHDSPFPFREDHVKLVTSRLQSSEARIDFIIGKKKSHPISKNALKTPKIFSKTTN